MASREMEGRVAKEGDGRLNREIVGSFPGSNPDIFQIYKMGDIRVTKGDKSHGDGWISREMGG